MRITIAGSGYVGLVTGACLANTGNRVIGYDINPVLVERLNTGECPIFESGLAELLSANRKAGRLKFTTDLKEAISHAEVVFIAIGTPPRDDGSADLTFIEEFARSMAAQITRPMIVAIKSTVPVGTGEHVEKIINNLSTHRVDVVSNPEFLKEGGAVRDFNFPDRVVIGAETLEAGRIIEELYKPFVRNQRPILQMSRRASEMTKYAANSYLASRISFINEIANLCDRLEIDVDQVRMGMGSDQRIGHHFLYPGAGYGGSCFPKDVRALRYVAMQAGIEPRMLSAIHTVNEEQKKVLSRKIRARYGDDLSNRTFAIWGLAFKPNTDDIREAPALNVIRDLLEAGASVRVHDAKAMTNTRSMFENRISYHQDAYGVLDGASALVICTEWNEFRSPDFEEIARRVVDRVIFDGRNLYEPSTVKRYGLEYYPIGRPAVRQSQG